MNLLRALFALALFQLCALASSAATWDVKITIVGRGTVTLYTFGDGESGPGTTFEQSGKVTVKDGESAYAMFTPADGYRILQLADNGTNIEMWEENSSASYEFEISGNHHLVVRFGAESPTGEFEFQSNDSSAATPIVDITGTYTGLVPTKGNPYTLDVAMDDSGKIDAMGTVDGFENKDGTDGVEGSGSLKTKNGSPTASGSASTEGTLDGEPVSGSGSANAPIEVTDGIKGPEINGVVVSGAGREKGVRFKEKRQMVTVPAQPANISKNWSLALSLAEKTNAKGKKYVAASGILTLSNGEKTQFNEKKVAYSSKRGYSVNFAKGVKLDALGNPILDAKGKPVIDRKSTMAISKMLLERTGFAWEPTAGMLKYKFLGQKGQGNVLDFK